MQYPSNRQGLLFTIHALTHNIQYKHISMKQTTVAGGCRWGTASRHVPTQRYPPTLNTALQADLLSLVLMLLVLVGTLGSLLGTQAVAVRCTWAGTEANGFTEALPSSSLLCVGDRRCLDNDRSRCCINSERGVI